MAGEFLEQACISQIEQAKPTVVVNDTLTNQPIEKGNVFQNFLQSGKARFAAMTLATASLAACGGAANGVGSANAATTHNQDPAAGCAPLKRYAVPAIPPSIFGQMYKQKGDTTQVPIDAEKASDQIRAQACSVENVGPLAVLYTLYVDVYSTDSIPSNLGADIQNNLNLFEQNRSRAITAEKDVISYFSILQSTTNNNPFVVNKGASEIVAINNGYEIKQASLTVGTEAGYVVAGNGQALNALERQRLNNLQGLVEFTTDGRVIINETLANAVISNNQAPAGRGGPNNQTNRKSSTSSSLPRQNKSGSTNANAGTGTGNKTTGKNGGGIISGNQGCGAPGEIQCGGGSGNQTGVEGPTGTGSGPSGGTGSNETTTTTTLPGSTTTTTTTLPGSTTTTTSTSTTIVKGPAPTNPNPGWNGN